MSEMPWSEKRECGEPMHDSQLPVDINEATSL